MKQSRNWIATLATQARDEELVICHCEGRFMMKQSRNWIATLATQARDDELVIARNVFCDEAI